MNRSVPSQVTLIAARELEVGFRSKQFYVSMGVSLLLIIAVILIPRLMSGDTEQIEVSVRGTQEQRSALGEMLPEASVFAFVDATEGAASEVSVDLTARPPRIDAQTSSKIAQAAPLIPIVQLLVERELRGSAGAEPEAVPVVSFVEDDSARGARIVLAYVLSILLFLQIAGLGSSVAQGTLEEKGNRVVDVLFPKVPPVRILVGKVLGIGLFGTIQMLLLGVVGVATVMIAGDETLRGDVLPAVAVSLGWFVLGYLFIGFLSGSVASTVTQPDQLPTVMLPLQLLNGLVFVTAVLSLQAVDSEWVRVLSMVPPFSAILMPIRVAAGTVPWVDVGVATVVALIAISVCIGIGARVYRRSVVGKAMRTSATTGEGD